MKSILTIIMSYILLQGINSPVAAQILHEDYNSPKCLETVWQWTNPTEEDKKFDLENDFGLYGSRFSCHSSVSASEINKVFNEIKSAVMTNNKRNLAELVIYPFGYWVKTEKKTDFGYIEHRKVANQQKFIEKYDEIVSDEFTKLLSCSTLQKFRQSGDGHVILASAFFHFNKHPDYNSNTIKDFYNYPLKLSSSGPFVKRHENWMKKHCE